jgi:hypothetical protein
MRTATSLLLAAVAFAACTSKSAPAPVALAPAPKCTPTVLVAHPGTPVLDGHLDQPVWNAAAATAPFVDSKADRVVPHTEARAAWDQKALYLVLYVADADLRTSDRVSVQFEGKGSIEARPNGQASCRFGANESCAQLGVSASFDVDGDVDADQEEDEEWAVELAVPWSLLASRGRPAEVPVAFTRDETLEGAAVNEVWTRGCGVIRVEAPPKAPFAQARLAPRP